MPKAKAKEEIYLGEDPEISEAKAEADQKALEKKLDQESSATENELQLLREQLAEERALREKAAERRKAWMKGDWSDLPMDHPFILTIHKAADISQNYPVPVTVNSDRRVIERGIPTEVPRYIVEVLKNSQIISPIDLVNPETGKRERIMENRHRFQFDAQPVGV